MYVHTHVNYMTEIYYNVKFVIVNNIVLNLQYVIGCSTLHVLLLGKWHEGKGLVVQRRGRD